MTNSRPLPPTRRHGSLEISCATFDDPVLYGRLLANAPSSGRCPVLLSDHALPALGEDRNPIRVLTEVNRLDATAVLADRWPGSCPSRSSWLAPFGPSFPGLAPRFADAADLQPDALVGAAVRMASEPRHMLLGIASADRPADVPAAAGWTGMCNSWDDGPKGASQEEQLGQVPGHRSASTAEASSRFTSASTLIGFRSSPNAGRA